MISQTEIDRLEYEADLEQCNCKSGRVELIFWRLLAFFLACYFVGHFGVAYV